jgi:hypothetical protein
MNFVIEDDDEQRNDDPFDPIYPQGDPTNDPTYDDSVKFCPDCGRPNQFGELCSSCQQEREIEAVFCGLRGDE